MGLEFLLAILINNENTKRLTHNKASLETKKELIVECDMDREKEDLIMSLGKIKYKLPMINSYVVEIPESHVEKLTNINGIQALYNNAKITAQMNNARIAVNAKITDDLELDGSGVTIAILDTGISEVDDFEKPINRIIAFKDFVNNKTSPYDDNGHGTHVAVLKTLQVCMP